MAEKKAPKKKTKTVKVEAGLHKLMKQAALDRDLVLEALVEEVFRAYLGRKKG